MKFVYPYRRKLSDDDILMSMRMLLYAYPDAEIFIIGDKPHTVIPLIHLPYAHHLTYAGCEVTDKVLLYCNMIGDEFILMNDDFFISEWYPLHNVMCYDHLHVNPSHSYAYQLACSNTIDWLTSNKLPLVNYECHQPVLIQSCKFIELFNDINYKEHTHLLKSMYFNTWPSRSYQGTNLKVAYSLKIARDKFNEYGAFSSGDDFWTKESKDFFNKYLGFAVSSPSAELW